MNEVDYYSELENEVAFIGLKAKIDENTIIELTSCKKDDSNYIYKYNIFDIQGYLTEEQYKELQELIPNSNNIKIINDDFIKIPVNSKSLLIEESTSRFSSAIWYDKIREKKVILAGVGGIGSYIAFLLSRMKIAKLIIFDDDTVEEANMSGQLYSTQNIGYPKVTAISKTIEDYSNFYNTIALTEKFTPNSESSDIMICGFDNMEARKIYFYKWLEHVSNKSEEDKAKCLFIDGRLAAEEFQILCITGNDTYNIEKYKKEFLFSDDEADETICSYKQTTFMANMIASVMVNLFTNFVANECDPLYPRDLPFYTSYDAATMYYKTQL